MPLPMRARFLAALVAALVAGEFPAASQCLSGDCQNGSGQLDLGYAVYTGTFRDGQPDGLGTMDYGGGDKYAGEWRAGKEEGAGLLFQKGVARPVRYAQGILQERPLPVVIGTDGLPKLQIPGCERGDCANGTGTVRFPSGNVYEGEFRNYQFNGHGRLTFASGNVLEGEFRDHVPQRGTFTYRADQITFTGTFTPDGQPATGTYASAVFGSEVTLTDGRITAVRNPRLEAARAQQAAASRPTKLQMCIYCGGKGRIELRQTSYAHIGGIGTLSPTGYVTWDYAPRDIAHTSFEKQVCSHCHGTGKEEVYR